MGRYILRRLISAIPVLLGISIIVFLIMAAIPGDPATAIHRKLFATPENVAKAPPGPRPRPARWWRRVFHLGSATLPVQGDSGSSFTLNRPVLDEILDRFGAYT